MTDINLFLTAMIDDMSDCTQWGIAEIVDEPAGEKQDSYIDACPFSHRYVNQSQNGDDSFFGDVYYPIDNGKYIRAWYSI